MDGPASPKTVANPLTQKVIHTVADIRITGVEDLPNDGTSSSQKLIPDREVHKHESTAEQKRASEMQMWWDDAMKKNFDLPDGYQKVAVLLIKWEDELDELNTRPEAEELEAVFRERFHYHTQTVELNVATKPQHQMSRFLSAFVEENDGTDNLMIIYYTGHGVYREEEDYLQLMGSINPASDKGFSPDARANWNRAEELLRGNDIEGDVLTILDTCYSSNLVKSGKEDTRTFELLSACAIDITTAAPGRNSFTRALIDALKELVEESGSFTTFLLNQRILLNPRRRDTPSVLWVRMRQDERHIRLSPLKPTRDRDRKQALLRQPPKAYLTLRFALRDDFLNQQKIEQLTKNLSKAFNKNALVGLKNIHWLGLKPARASSFGRAGLAIYAIAQWKRFVQKRKHERDASKTVDDVLVPMDITVEQPKAESTKSSPIRKRTRDTIDDYLPDAKRGTLVIPQPPSPPVSDQAEEATIADDVEA